MVEVWEERPMDYRIFLKLDTGELLRIATRDDFNQAERLPDHLGKY